MIETREPLLITRTWTPSPSYGNPAVVAGEPSKARRSSCRSSAGGGDGRDLGPEPRPRARVRRVRPAAARDDRRQPRRRARERAADPRDAPARRRARDREQRRPGARGAARARRADRARRRARPRDVRRRHRLRRPARRGRRADRVRLLLRERASAARAADAVRRGAHLADPRVARAAPAQPEGAARRRAESVGTPSKSYLGVPILRRRARRSA